MNQVVLTFRYGYLKACIDETYIVIKDVYFYDKKGVVFCGNFENVAMASINLNAEYEYHLRRNENFDRNEIFAIKIKGTPEHALYIPFSAVNGEFIGQAVEKGDDYQYIYNWYKITAMGVTSFTCTSHTSAIRTLDNGTIKIKAFVKMEKTDEKIAADRLCQDIQRVCGISVDPWKISRMLKHYKITKKRVKKLE